MNVYTCHYKEASGYCCRIKKGNWLFVPELNARNGSIHRHLKLEELTFSNQQAQAFEYRQELNTSMYKQIIDFFFPPKPSLTIGGLLYAPGL